MFSSEELDFKRAIDCLFPYNDIDSCISLMNVAMSISHEAMFSVLHEICRTPKSENVSPATQLKLADIWLEKSSHPISSEIYAVAKTMIARENISVEQSILLLNKLFKYSDLSSAFHIVYFSCDDLDGKMECHYDMIVRQLKQSACS